MRVPGHTYVCLFIFTTIAQVAWSHRVFATTSTYLSEGLRPHSTSSSTPPDAVLPSRAVAWSPDAASAFKRSVPPTSHSTVTSWTDLTPRAGDDHHRKGSFFHLGPGLHRGRGHFSTTGASSSGTKPQPSRVSWSSSSGSDSDTPHTPPRRHGSPRRPSSISFRSAPHGELFLGSSPPGLRSSSSGSSRFGSSSTLHSITSSGGSSRSNSAGHTPRNTPATSPSTNRSPSPLTTFAPSRARTSSSTSSLIGSPHASSPHVSSVGPTSTHSSPGASSQAGQEGGKLRKLKKSLSW